MTALTVNIQKGGALVEDTRRVVEAWNVQLDPEIGLAPFGRAISYSWSMAACRRVTRVCVLIAVRLAASWLERAGEPQARLRWR